MDKTADEKSGGNSASGAARRNFRSVQRTNRSREMGQWMGSSAGGRRSSRAERKSENRENATDFLRQAEDGMANEPISEPVWGADDQSAYETFLDKTGSETSEMPETSGDLASAASEAGKITDAAGENTSLAEGRGFYNEKKETDKSKKVEDETKVGEGASGLNKREEGGAGKIPFTGGQNSTSVSNKKKKKKAILQGKGPVVAIIILIATAAGMALSSLSLMPFVITELATELYDQAYTARIARMPKIANWVFNLENDESAVTKEVHRIFGDDYVKYRRFSARNKAGLAAQGIEVKGKGKNAVLEWTHQDWDVGVEGDPDFGELKLRTKTEEITAAEYGAKYRSDTDFRNSFNKGTRTFTGRIAGWIDLSAAKFFDKFSITKTLFSNWIEKIARQEDDTEFLDTIKARKQSIDVGETGTTEIKEKEEVDGEGNTTRNTETDVKAGKGAAEVVESINNVAQMTTGLVCGYATIAATLTGIKAAITVQNAINFAQAGNEAVQKTKYGDGPGSPTNTYANTVTKRDGDGNYPLLAQGLLYIVSGGTKEVQMDAATLSTNIEELYRSFGSSIGAVLGCTIAQGVTATISLVAGLFTAGTFSIGRTIIAGIANVAISEGIKAVVNRVVAGITSDQCVGEVDGLADDTSGALAQGACLALGMSSELSTNALYGGSSPGDAGMVAKNENARAATLVYEAEYDRANYSPFDVTNKNTFFGSLARTVATSLATFGGNGTLISLASGMSSMAASSMAALVPGANAAEIRANLTGNCPSLQSIGIEGYGDGSCNPIAVNDMSTANINPEENLTWIANKGGFEKDGDKVKVSGGVEQIDEKSNLGKYINYCTNRESPYGTIDQNIIDAETAISTGNGTADAALSAVPILGDAIDMLNSIDLVGGDTLGWASGATCAAKSGDNANATKVQVSSKTSSTDLVDSFVSDIADGYEINTVSWNEIKHYAQYVTDDKIMETADPENYNSAVMAYIEKQEAKNPIDNSFEGWLARRTGQRKETVAYALNEVKYWTYVANYDATDKYPKLEETKEFNIQELTPEEMEMPLEVLAKREQNVIYEDLRRVSIA